MSLQLTSYDWINLVVYSHPVSALLSLSKTFKNNKAKLILVDLPPYMNGVNYNRKKKSPYFKFHNISNHSFFTTLIDAPSDTYFQAICDLLQATKTYLSSDSFLCLKAIGSKRHYLKIILDQVLGYEHFVNEIIIDSPYIFRNCQNQSFVEATGSLFLYSSNPRPRINAVRNKIKGGGYWHTMHSKGQGNAKIFTFQGKKHLITPPTGNHWKFKQETIDKMCQEGKIRLNSKGQPLYWIESTKGQIIDSLWLDLPSYQPSSLGFESSEELLTRLLQLTTNKDDLFVHVFCGSGFGLIAAEKIDRKWIGINMDSSSSFILKERLEKAMKGKTVLFEVWNENNFP
ncbi:MAG: DNA methyltransferase [Candidatus Hermodarchaeota archaeon]